jgi:hypothetical protein
VVRGPRGRGSADFRGSTPCKTNCPCTSASGVERGQGAAAVAGQRRCRTAAAECTAGCLRAPRRVTRMPSSTDTIRLKQSRAGERLRSCCGMARALLGWRAQETFETGLAKTVRWYLDNRAWWQSIIDRGYDTKRIGLAGSMTQVKVEQPVRILERSRRTSRHLPPGALPCLHNVSRRVSSGPAVGCSFVGPVKLSPWSRFEGFEGILGRNVALS